MFSSHYVFCRIFIEKILPLNRKEKYCNQRLQQSYQNMGIQHHKRQWRND